MNTFSNFTPKRISSSLPLYRNVFQDIFDDTFFNREFAGYMPAVNIAEDEKAWHIELSAAGFKKEDFTLKIENDTLTIKAEHKEEEKAEQKNYSRREFRYGSFSRSFSLVKDKVNADAISGVYENGILKVTVPKKSAEPKTETKEIKIA